MSQPTLYLMLGYPGAGKTTTAKIVERLTGAVRLSSDEIRLELFPHPKFSEDEHRKLYEHLDHETARLLRAGKSVIYDANLNRYQHRHDKYAICQELQANRQLLWIQTSQPISKDRATHHSRSHLWKEAERPEAMFDRLVGVFEEPHQDEPFVALDGTAITPDYVAQKLGL